MDNNGMKLQIAFDDVTLADALSIMEQTYREIDIMEVGTPLLMKYGMNAVTILKNAYPNHIVLCDTKIMDAGGYEASMAFQAGADIVTVLGVTDDLTIADCVAAAEKAGRKVMADMICVLELGKRAQIMEEMGVDIIGVHTGVDQQAAGRTPRDDLKELRSHVKRAALSVAGGITVYNIDKYLPYHPEIIIAGGGITKASEPAAAAKELAAKMVVSSEL